jgi:hypothetical protein
MAKKTHDPQTWVTYLFSDRHIRLCAVVALVVALMPAEGIPGLDLCVYRRWTGLPCPGCGITRSGSNLVRGNFARAVNYHPFGPLLMPPIFLLGALILVPRSWCDRARNVLLGRAAQLRRAYLAFIVLFIVFGLLRSWCVFGQWFEFPATWL